MKTAEEMDKRDKALLISLKPYRDDKMQRGKIHFFKNGCRECEMAFWIRYWVSHKPKVVVAKFQLCYLGLTDKPKTSCCSCFLGNPDVGLKIIDFRRDLGLVSISEDRKKEMGLVSEIGKG